MDGQVISIENSDVLFKPSIEGIEDLRVPIENVSKFFDPGDQVKVSDGKFKGETGLIVSLDDKFANVALSKNLREVRILANCLKLKTEIDQSLMPEAGLIDKMKFGSYSANDLIIYNTKFVGVVLKVDDDFLRVINDQGQLQNVKYSEINKKIDFSKKTTAIDSHRNTIYSENVVRITQGRFKGKKGVIKFIHKNTLFLWDREFH